MNKNGSPRASARGELHSGERGFILIAVLWFGLGLSAVASYLAVSAQVQMRRAEAGIDSARRDVSVIEAAAHWSVAAVRTGQEDLRGTEDGAWRITRTFDGTDVDIAFTPLETLVDLNVDDVASMALAFRARGLDEDTASAIAARVMDFRDADSLRSVNGAERDDYLSAGLPPPRNGAFLSVEDISLVLGMTPEILQLVRPILVVRGGVIDTAASTQVIMTGNRLDPVGGSRRSTRLRGSGVRVRIFSGEVLELEFVIPL